MAGSVMFALFRKKAAELSAGYYSRGAIVRLSSRSRYNTRPEDAVCELGMGIVQAILAVLSGHVTRISWSDGGKRGTLHLLSTSGPGEYDFTWDESDPELGLYGGFQNGPTYQLAVLHLVLCYLSLYHGESERGEEVVQRWLALVQAMARQFTGGFTRGKGWSKTAVAEACWNPSIQSLIEGVADAMWFAMRYRIPDASQDRLQDLYSEQVLPLPLTASITTLPGAALFVRLRPRVSAQHRRRRLEEQVSLNQGQLQGLALQREKRIVGSLPVWHFPTQGDD